MKAYKQTVIKYHKYIENEGSLPTFTSASQASSGVNGVSVSPADIWSAIGTSYNTKVANSDNAYYTFDFEGGAKITSLTYQGYVVANSLPRARCYGIEAYDETTQQWVSLSSEIIETTLTTITLDNNTFYKQYRINLKGSEVGTYASMGVVTVNMGGTFRTLQETDETDYDYFVESEVYYLPKINNKYYGIGGS